MNRIDKLINEKNKIAVLYFENGTVRETAESKNRQIINMHIEFTLSLDFSENSIAIIAARKNK